MGTHNGSHRYDSARQFVDQRFDAFKEGAQKVYDRVMKEPDGSPSWFRTWSTNASKAIKAHPYMAIGIACGLGYAVIRIARR